MLTDGVSIVPSPSPISSRPGANAQALGEPCHQGKQNPDTGDRDDESRDDEGPLRVPLGEPFGAERRSQYADRGRVKITPVWIAS